MSYDDVKDRTSAAVGEKHEDGALFDETATAYSMRRKAAQELLVGALVESHNKAFRAYTTRVQWTTVGETAILGKSTSDFATIEPYLTSRQMSLPLLQS